MSEEEEKLNPKMVEEPVEIDDTKIPSQPREPKIKSDKKAADDLISQLE